jgi:gluconokinase
MERRADHYMPASLLPSQLATLEPLEPDEPGVEVSVDGEAPQVIARALAALDLQPPGTRTPRGTRNREGNPT